MTTSERVALAEAIEAELSKRLGINQHSKEGVENFPHPPEAGRTRDIAAKTFSPNLAKTMY